MREIKYLEKPSFLEAIKRDKNSKVETIHYDNKEMLSIFFNNEESLKERIKYINNTFYIKTHGCQANIRDEEIISGILSSINIKRVDDINEASIIIINTCSVRENANNKVYAEIGNIKKIKEKNKNVILILCGCMVETKDTLNKLITTFPFIDIIFGTHNIDKLLYLLYLYMINNNKVRIVDVSSKEGEIIEDLPSKRNNSYSAYVNISFGCDKFCTYCIVPQTRGKERSRAKEDIINECKLLIAEGYKEIILLGQNVDSYGKDLKDNNINFASLLDEVASLNIPRVRFLTSYPSEFSEEVIDVIARHDNIMKYIHLPVQSGSNSVLKRMGRRYTKEEYLKLVNKIKTKIKDVALSTDIIVGFPNESEEEFLDTIDLVKKVKYASAFTFIYSPREGTAASKMEDKIDEKTKVERFKRLTNELEKYYPIYNSQFINRIMDVLVTSLSKKDKDKVSGVMFNNKIVNFKGDKSLIGKIVKVKILEDKLYSFNGELVEG